ncbi:MAG: hypothetical protein JNJ58_07575 [Chitinophagaceae bacterium]|nr:hypothetical protein [Chitinophagaceae bacterium]
MITNNNLNGAILMVVLAAALLSIPFCFILINYYRRKLIQGMGYKMKTVKTDSSNDPAPAQVPQARFNTINPAELNTRDVKNFFKLKEFLGYNWFVYIISIGIAALCLSAIMLSCSHIDLSAWRIAYTALFYLWPLLLASLIIITSSTFQRFIFIIAYFIFNLMIVYIFYAQGQITPNYSFGKLLLPVLIINFLPTLFVLILLLRKIRGISFLMATMFMVAFGLTFLFINAPDRDVLAGFIVDSGMGVEGLYLFWLLCFLIALIFCFLIALSIRVMYNKKLITDQTLIIDSIIIIHAVVYSVNLVVEKPAYGLFVILYFLIYKAVSILLFYLLRRFYPLPAPRKLLMLRVFALGAKSRQLFEHLCKHWRFYGPVQMISGPDLAASTVDPHEMMNFLSGKLKDSFCDDEASIKKNTSEADYSRDFDGCFRIHEFFCRDNTWKLVLQALVKNNDLVLMDLRSFNPQYKGCQYEINQLVNTFRLDKILFLINGQTDLPFTESCFREAFQQIPASSPNANGEYAVTFFDYRKESYAHTLKLLNLMCGIAE